MDTTRYQYVLRSLVSTRVRKKIHYQPLQIRSVAHASHGRLICHDRSQMRVLVGQIKCHIGHHVTEGVSVLHHALEYHKLTQGRYY